MHKIHLIGESAGGGLILSTLQYIQEKYVETSIVASNVGLAVLLSPFTDMSLKYTHSSYEENKNKDAHLSLNMITSVREFVSGIRNAEGQKTKDFDDKLFELWYISPIYGNVRKMTSARILFTVSQYEILRDDSVQMYNKIKSEDKTRKVDIWFYNSTVHALPVLAPYIPEAMDAVLNIAFYMKHHIAELDQA
ncbi:putative acetyl-hydrolase [Reticulomyxa filosa]|uniref:Putative acetyl-hydrolase n=1 Tax=Reticulomyxa filosa TaxID=46433 RepID=X6N3G5_RETFI|nr:putative acetyl-hydrolase [Reticulomyxa filosa]|eukprot:ETO20621.1 putative acetyl-hydrolase [Reticulomyxa filosa]